MTYTGRGRSGEEISENRASSCPSTTGWVAGSLFSHQSPPTSQPHIRVRKPGCSLVYDLSPEGVSAADVIQVFSAHVAHSALPRVQSDDHFIGHPGGIRKPRRNGRRCSARGVSQACALSSDCSSSGAAGRTVRPRPSRGSLAGHTGSSPSKAKKNPPLLSQTGGRRCRTRSLPERLENRASSPALHTEIESPRSTNR